MADTDKHPNRLSSGADPIAISSRGKMRALSSALIGKTKHGGYTCVSSAEKQGRLSSDEGELADSLLCSNVLHRPGG